MNSSFPDKGKRNVFYMGWVSFFMDVSSEMIFPVLPLFLSQILGINRTLIGLIEGGAQGFSSIIKVVSGWFSDRLKKRKIIVVAGYSLATIAKPLLFLASSWFHVLGARFLDRLGKGIREAPRDALIADSTRQEERARFFGLHRTLDTAGAVVGTLIVFLILHFKGTIFRPIFLIATLPAIFSVLILISKVQERKKGELEEFVEKIDYIHLANLHRRFIHFLLVALLFNLGNFSYAFFILRAQEKGLNITLIPLVYLIYNIVYAGLALPLGKMADRIGRRKTIILGYLIFGFMALGFASQINPGFLWFLFALYGMALACIEGVSRAYVSTLVSPKSRASALGIYHTISGLAIIPASLVGGFLGDKLGLNFSFGYAAFMAFLAAIFLIIFRIKENYAR